MTQKAEWLDSYPGHDTSAEQPPIFGDSSQINLKTSVSEPSSAGEESSASLEPPLPIPKATSQSLSTGEQIVTERFSTIKEIPNSDRQLDYNRPPASEQSPNN